MVVYGTDWPTLVDVASRSHEGNIQTIAEILEQTNEILPDIPIITGNTETGHKGTIRSGLPTVAWRILNRGVPASKSRTMQVIDTCGQLAAIAQVDEDIANTNGNSAEFRLSEDRAFIQALNIEFAETLFYGNTGTDPEEFLGLTPRFSDVTADNGGMIGGGGGATDLTSVWLVCWGPNTIHGIVPKGSTAGIQHKDWGLQLVEDEDGYKLPAYVSTYKLNIGMHMRDWRYIARLCNIDHTALTTDATAGANLVEQMTNMLEIVQDLSLGRPVFYVGRKVRRFLRHQIKNTNNVNLTMEQVAGKKVIAFDGVPVRVCEALNMDETAVVGPFEW